MFQETMEAIRQGQRNRARDLLTRLLRADPANIQYWLWMSAMVDSRKEQIYCLQKVQFMDPANPAARRGLVLLGGAAPDEGLAPAPIQRRKWDAGEVDLGRPKPSKRALALRASGLIFALILVTSLLAWGLNAGGLFRRPVAAVIPTRTPGPTPTFTLTPTFVNAVAPATARPAIRRTEAPTVTSQPTRPLSMDYTATPIYIDTPHPASEAYRSAKSALLRKDWEDALDKIGQAIQNDPKAADLYYYQGEIYRTLARYEEAGVAFERALALDKKLGPAYLGRAQVKLEALPPDEPLPDVLSDLNQAIKLDPNFGEGYLGRGYYWLLSKEPEKALEDLEVAAGLLPGSPQVSLYQAQALLQLGQAKEALQAARLANQSDLSLLPAYRVLGEACLLNGDGKGSLQALQIYLNDQPEDVSAWVLLGRAQLSLRQYPAALEALTRALELDEKNFEATYYRGLTYLEAKSGQEAVNDLVKARKLNSKDFSAALALGRALFVTDRLDDARGVLNASLPLAKSAEQQAQVLYWRAKVYEAGGDRKNAALDWRALLKLPEGSAPEEWLALARKQLTPTSTPTATASPTPRTTASPTRTPRATASPRAATPTPRPVTPATP